MVVALPAFFAAAGRRFLASLLIPLAAVTGCTEQSDDAIRFGIATAPSELDPRFATDAISDRIARLLYRPLVAFDERAMPVPELASWERLANTHYRFELVNGARFTNGDQISAADVTSTYRSILDPDGASPHRKSLSNILRVEAIDSRHIDFFLHRPDALFPATLVIGIMSASDVQKGEQQVFSGDFSLVKRTHNGGVQLLRRRDGQVVSFVVIKDVTARVLRLVSGDLDLLQGGLSPELFRWLEQQPDVTVQRTAGSTFSYLGFNWADDFTGKRAVRQAVAHAIDRSAIIEHVFTGTARPAGGFFPPEHWAGHDRLTGYDFDPVRARALLAEAGGLDRPLRMEYKTSSDRFRQRIAVVIQDQLRDVGIEVTVASHEWGTFYGDIKSGRFQSYGLSWVGLKLPDIFRYATHSTSAPPAGANRGHYLSKPVDALIERAEREQSLDRAAEHYREIAELLLYDLPFIPLWYEDQLVITRTNIVGYSTNEDGHFAALADTYRRP